MLHKYVNPQCVRHRRIDEADTDIHLAADQRVANSLVDVVWFTMKTIFLLSRADVPIGGLFPNFAICPIPVGPVFPNSHPYAVVTLNTSCYYDRKTSNDRKILLHEG